MNRPSQMNLNFSSYILLFLPLALWYGHVIEIPGFALQAVDISIIGLAFMVVLEKLTQGRFVIKLYSPLSRNVAWIGIGLIFIILASVISTLNAENMVNTFKFSIRYLLGGIVILAILDKGSQAVIDKLVKMLMVGSVVSVLLVLAGYVFQPLGNITIGIGGRAQGLLLNPNQFGMLLAAVIPIALTKAMSQIKNTLYWIVLVVLIIGLILTGSKMNLLLMVCASWFTILLTITLKSGVTKKIITLVISAGISYLSLLVVLNVLEKLMPTTYSRIQLLFNDPFEVSAVSTRVETWEAAIRLGKENPLTGVGANNIGFHIWHNHAHNVFIEYFATMGLIGLSSLVIFLISLMALIISSVKYTYKMSVQHFTERSGVMGLSVGIFSYIISNQTSDSFGGTTIPLLWILVGVLCSQVNVWIKSGLQREGV